MRRIRLLIRGFILSKWDRKNLREAYYKYQKLKNAGFPTQDARRMCNLREDRQFETALFLHRNFI